MICVIVVMGMMGQWSRRDWAGLLRGRMVALMTDLLCYADSYVQEFDATVTGSTPKAWCWTARPSIRGAEGSRATLGS